MYMHIRFILVIPTAKKRAEHALSLIYDSIFSFSRYSLHSLILSSDNSSKLQASSKDNSFFMKLRIRDYIQMYFILFVLHYGIHNGMMK
jgi:hypothetical protein